MPVRIWDALCIAVLGVIFSLGLWPFHLQKNNVQWLRDRNGLRIGKAGSVLGDGVPIAVDPHKDTGAAIEAWVRPEKVWDFGTILTLYRPKDSRQFSMRQSLVDLEVQFENPERPTAAARLDVADIFPSGAPVFITLTSSPDGMTIYINGAKTRTARGLSLSAADLAARIILGDSPRQTRYWKGAFYGLAFYGRPLTDGQVLTHFESWAKSGRPTLVAEDDALALYLFDEHAGAVAHSRIGSGSLNIPQKYSVVDKELLEPVWREFELTGSYLRAIEKNIVGFIPFGFLFYAYWVVARPIAKPALATIALGAAVSFTIEFFQAYLPVRESGMTDIITNTLGTALGVFLYRATVARMQRTQSFRGRMG